MQLFIILSLSIAILAVTFALQNPTVIAIKFLIWEFTGSMALVLLLTFFLGFIASFFISSAAKLKKKMNEDEDEQSEED